MINQTWQPNALAFEPNPTASWPAPFSAQKSDDGKTLVMRFVNGQPNATSVVTNLKSSAAAACAGSLKAIPAKMWTLSAPSLMAANPPGNPALISPRESAVTVGDGAAVTVPALSYVVVVATLPAAC